MSSDLRKRYLSEAIHEYLRGNRVERVAWRSPSNIALVKYWGKKPGQIPENASLSITLAHSVTEMMLSATTVAGGKRSMEFMFEGRRQYEFEKRISGFLDELRSYFPFLGNMALRISSRNTFPHSSGIASSASSMSALALCICGLEERISGKARGMDFFRKASYMARLGSGSASRSVYGGFVQWGEREGVPEASNDYAQPLDIPRGSIFHTLRDAILIISSDSKKTSSSQGHVLMESHPYAGARYRQAALNLENLVLAIQSEDLQEFIRIVENEAMSLHGLMFSSNPAVLLLKEGSLAVISKVLRFREETGAFLTFTIDAGPNIHLIYPDSQADAIQAFIASELLEHCEGGRWIDDAIGGGPSEIQTL